MSLSQFPSLAGNILGDLLIHKPGVLFILGIFPLVGVTTFICWRLSKRLNPLFDGRFQRHLSYMDWTPVLFPPASFARAGFYALCVVSPRIFAKGLPGAQSYDFRAQIGRKTVLLCWLHLAIVLYYLAVLLGVVLVYWLRR